MKEQKKDRKKDRKKDCKKIVGIDARRISHV